MAACRRIFWFGATALLVGLQPACGGDDSPTKPEPVPEPAQVLVTPSADTLDWLTATAQFTATVRSNTGTQLTTPVTWTSSAAGVATVSSTGMVTAAGVGTSTIVAQAGTVSGSATVVVRQVPAVVSKLSGDDQAATIGVRLAPLVVEVKDQGGATIAGARLTWSVSQGGGSLESASAETDANGQGQAVWRLGETVGAQLVQVSAGTLVPVSFAATGYRLTTAAVRLTPARDTLDFLGDTLRFTALATAADGRTITDVTPSFTSTNSGVLSVRADGLATATGTGTAAIIARAESMADTAVVVVRQLPASAHKISGDGQSGFVAYALATPLVLEVRDAGGAVIPNLPVTWSGTGTFNPASTTTAANGRTQSTWTLGGVLGTQVAQATTAGLTPITFTAIAARHPVARMDLLPNAATVSAVGDTVRFTGTPRDAAGVPVLGIPTSYTSSNPAVAAIDATGLASAMGQGTAQIIAVAEGKADTSTLTVQLPVVAITRVEPAVLVEGALATIEGRGFSAVLGGNSVLVDGVAAQVLASTATSLQIRVPTADCRPARHATLRVRVQQDSAHSAITVAPAAPWRLEVNAGTFAEGCIQLAQGTGAEQYLVQVVSTAEAPATLTLAALSTQAGLRLAASPEATSAGRFRVPAAPARAQQRPGVAAPPRAPDLHQGEAAIREREQRMVASVGLPRLREEARLARAERLALTAQLRAVEAGDSLQLKVPTSCSVGALVRAVVRHVGSGLIFLEDVQNPVDSAFTTAELQAMDAFYVQHTLPTLTSYFGNFNDVDVNQRVLVLITREVNRLGGVNGFTWSGDLRPQAACPFSNYAEVFYGVAPDPAGVHGRQLDAATVRSLYPPLLAHQVAHVLQFTQQIHAQAGAKTSWELEGGATLAEQLVGNRALGHGSRQNLGLAAFQLGRDSGWYGSWATDLGHYFGDSGTGHLANAPEQCSWLGRAAEGNAGPCDAERTIHGAAATFLRMLLDDYGPSFYGGETALMRTLTGSPESGLSNIARHTTQDPALALVRFSNALWADGRTGDWLRSWDLQDVFSGFGDQAQLQPYTSTAAEPTLSVSVRAGSSAYLLWTPPSPHGSLSVRIRTPGGAPLPAHMVVSVLRVK